MFGDCWANSGLARNTRLDGPANATRPGSPKGRARHGRVLKKSPSGGTHAGLPTQVFLNESGLSQWPDPAQLLFPFARRCDQRSTGFEFLRALHRQLPGKLLLLGDGAPSIAAGSSPTTCARSTRGCTWRSPCLALPARTNRAAGWSLSCSTRTACERNDGEGGA